MGIDDKSFFTIEELIDEGFQIYINKDGSLDIFELADNDYGSSQTFLKHRTFKYIEKTDDTPEQNKIYADCSIVEFDFKYFIDDDYWKVRGYFSFNKDLAQYEIREPYSKDCYRIYYLKDSDIKNIKVIGTIQENPELLRDNQ